MALIKCKECGKEISDSVKSCPHCGYVYKEEKKMTTGKVIKIVIIMAIIGIALFFGITYLFFDYIPKVKQNKKNENYYGKYELVFDGFNEYNNLEDIDGNINNIFPDNYVAINNFEITKNNLKIDSGFGNFDYGFSTGSWDELDTILVITLDQLVKYDSSNQSWKGRKLCFNKKDDTLVQIDCPLGQMRSVGIVYKQVK